jgi:uncharacterized membrane protein
MADERNLPAPRPRSETTVNARAAQGVRQTEKGFEMQAAMEVYQGFLPHPDHAERFEAVLPGSNDRILRMAEKQGEHRQRMEWRFLQFNGWGQLMGTLFGGIIVLAGIGCGTYLAMNDKSVAALFAGLTPLGVIAGIFVSQRGKQQQQIAQREKVQMQGPPSRQHRETPPDTKPNKRR